MVTAIHLSVDNADGDEGTDVVSYDLSYLMTHDSFIAAYEDSLSMKKQIAKAAAGTSIATEARQGAAMTPWTIRDTLDAERDLSKSLYDRITVASASASSAGNGSRALGTCLQSAAREFRESLIAAAARHANGCDDESKQEHASRSSGGGLGVDAALHATILGSAALSATFLGSTLSSRKAPSATVVLSAEDWHASITHACAHAAGEDESKNSSNEAFADGALAVLDISTYN